MISAMESSSTDDAFPDDTSSSEPAPESTAGPAKSIQAIDKTSVHRICSGQVVLNLATAVKELVENSVDAGATSIEVRLKEYGSELIEVVDNGSGVEESNFQALTLKHHTSKLQDFSDLTSVDTFGFRGEALSSLCALSKLNVTTRHEKATVGHKLEYEHSGKLHHQTPCARQKGTTVTLQNIFSTLPVRHKEFSRNLKKEFAKMVQVLSAYCIVTTSVRITCTNQLGKGKKNIVVNTVGNDTIKENITNIFGPKQMQSLLEFEQSQQPSDETSTEYNIKASQPDGEVFKVTGYVSSSEHGHGRSSTDRQFYYINHRPCDFLKVSRLVNEVYHMYNRHQYPFVVLDISLCKESVDVNVTPDKRQIFIQHEKLLLAIIKTSLMKMFEPRSALVPLNMTQSLHSSQTGAGSLSSSFSRKSLSMSPGMSPLGKQHSCPQLPQKKSLSSSLANLKRNFSSAFAKEQSGTAVEQSPKDQKQRRLDSFISTSARSPSNSASFLPSSSSNELGTPPAQKDCIEARLFCDSNVSPCSAKDSAVSMDDDSGPQTDQEPHLVCIIEDSNETMSATDKERTLPDTSTETVSLKYAKHDQLTNSNETTAMTAEKNCDAVVCKTMTPIQTSPDSVYDDNSPTSPQNSPGTAATEDPIVTFTELDGPEENIERKTVSVPFSMNAFRERILNKKKHREKSRELYRSFRAKINPADNQSAENELKKEISKDMFSKMQILGQFNLGFIIGKLGSDLFIIDQHATDEKYNFEMLQRHTVIQSQKLICPQDLELTAVNETILMDNLDIFEKNGFKFSINEDAPPTRRIKLAFKPVSKNWEFGKQDIEELVFMLSDTPGVMCRPSRIRQMFASRSCRKAIMIGTALSSRQMRQLVDHMGEIEQPWNCPHGRPTMRHLINMNMLPS